MVDTISFLWAMGIWFVLSGLVLFTYCYICEKVKEHRDIYGCTLRRFDIAFMIVFFPLTIVGGIIVCLMWLWFEFLDLIHFENVTDWLNQPIKRKND